jgi:hypothetical protein
MTRDDIIRIAKNEYGIYAFTAKTLEHFIDLVAAAERERLDPNAIHTCHAECQNPFCVRVREAVEHEREACAKLCEDGPFPKDPTPFIHIPTLLRCAAAIRARGEP